MNKQEAIKEIEQIWVSHLTIGEFKEKVISFVNQIDERPKVKIPQFVADWIERQKKVTSLSSALISSKPVAVEKWFENSEGYPDEIIARAWFDGYEVEQEKRYTVEIPNPWGSRYAILKKGDGELVEIFMTPNFIKSNEYYQLTEAEIKKDFEWAWQFAEEVEE